MAKRAFADHKDRLVIPAKTACQVCKANRDRKVRLVCRESMAVMRCPVNLEKTDFPARKVKPAREVVTECPAFPARLACLVQKASLAFPVRKVILVCRVRLLEKVKKVIRALPAYLVRLVVMAILERLACPASKANRQYGEAKDRKVMPAFPVVRGRRAHTVTKATEASPELPVSLAKK